MKTKRGRRDGTWQNVLTGLGTWTRDKTRHTVPHPPMVLQPNQLAWMFQGDDLVRKIVSWLPEDALRQGMGWEDGSANGDPQKTQALNDAVRLAFKKWGAKDLIFQGDVWGRLFGYGVIWVGVVNAGDPTEPLEDDEIGPGDLKFFEVLDRRDLTVVDRYSDPLDPKFGEPSLYAVVRATTGLQSVPDARAFVHESRLIQFTGALTDRRARIENQGFSHSVLQAVYDVLQETAQNWKSVVGLMGDVSQGVYKIKNLVQMLLADKEAAIAQRMVMIDQQKSTVRGVLLDADKEDYTRVATPLTGVDEMILRTWQRIAAAANMSCTRLFGMSPAGMNATGESDRAMDYDRIQAHREAITPQLERLARIIGRSEGLANAEKLTVCWPSLYQLPPDKKADVYLKTAQGDQIYEGMGAATFEEIALERSKKGDLDPGFPEIDREARKKALDKDLKKLVDEAGKPTPEPPAPGEMPPKPNGQPTPPGK